MHRWVVIGCVLTEDDTRFQNDKSLGSWVRPISLPIHNHRADNSELRPDL
jgi:hypothetical protein